MGAANLNRYVNTNGVPNSNTGTYTFPANDTGGTKDLGEANNYRYVNAQNVYNKGKADGAAFGNPGDYLRIGMYDCLAGNGTSISMTSYYDSIIWNVEGYKTFSSSASGVNKLYGTNDLRTFTPLSVNVSGNIQNYKYITFYNGIQATLTISQ